MSVDKLQFVDTNILVYAYDRSTGEKHIRANALLRSLWETNFGCISLQVLQEFHVTVTRKVAVPLGLVESSEIIRDLSAWAVHTPSANDLLAAIQIQQQYGLSFWDAMIVRSASQLGCECIWSEDMAHGQAYAGVRVLNPLVA
jgi:predicted nucleic acid-binding protein